ncbi:hypothetical protein A6J60_010930 [Psychrobacter sp. FDAARGOS_221]|nr:hypothetical protein A6J60_010930 [Psychrobacter sp. FDAARGOS_221]
MTTLRSNLGISRQGASHLAASTSLCDKKTTLKRLLSALMAAAVIGSPLLLSGCGFHLRGYETPLTYSVSSAVLSIDDDPVSFRLKQPLKEKLNSVGVQVADDVGRQVSPNDALYSATIRVDNVEFRRYELVGILTEIRLVLSADVTYETIDTTNTRSNQPVIIKNTIQVERTYQFDEASVSIEDKQGEQIQDWLYQNLAQRIADQYVALNLPRVAPKARPASSSQSSSSTPSNSVSTSE